MMTMMMMCYNRWWSMCDDVDYVIIIIIIIFIFIVDSDYDRRHTKNVND